MSSGVQQQTGVESSSGTEYVRIERDRLMDIKGSMQELAAASEQMAQSTDEVNGVADEQAASTEEVAAMADDANDRARMMADEIDELAAANQQQTAKVSEIADILESVGEDRATEITAGD